MSVDPDIENFAIGLFRKMWLQEGLADYAAALPAVPEVPDVVCEFVLAFRNLSAAFYAILGEKEDYDKFAHSRSDFLGFLRGAADLLIKCGLHSYQSGVFCLAALAAEMASACARRGNHLFASSCPLAYAMVLEEKFPVPPGRKYGFDVADDFSDGLRRLSARVGRSSPLRRNLVYRLQLLKVKLYEKCPDALAFWLGKAVGHGGSLDHPHMYTLQFADAAYFPIVLNVLHLKFPDYLELLHSEELFRHHHYVRKCHFEDIAESCRIEPGFRELFYALYEESLEDPPCSTDEVSSIQEFADMFSAFEDLTDALKESTGLLSSLTETLDGFDAQLESTSSDQSEDSSASYDVNESPPNDDLRSSASSTSSRDASDSRDQSEENSPPRDEIKAKVRIPRPPSDDDLRAATSTRPLSKCLEPHDAPTSDARPSIVIITATKQKHNVQPKSTEANKHGVNPTSKGTTSKHDVSPKSPEMPGGNVRKRLPDYVKPPPYLSGGLDGSSIPIEKSSMAKLLVYADPPPYEQAAPLICGSGGKRFGECTDQCEGHSIEEWIFAHREVTGSHREDFSGEPFPSPIMWSLKSPDEDSSSAAPVRTTDSVGASENELSGHEIAQFSDQVKINRPLSKDNKSSLTKDMAEDDLKKSEKGSKKRKNRKKTKQDSLGNEDSPTAEENDPNRELVAHRMILVMGVPFQNPLKQGERIMDKMTSKGL